MRKLFPLLICVLVCCLPSVAGMENSNLSVSPATAVATPAERNLNGVWQDDGPGMSNAYVTYSQAGDQITVKGSFVYQGVTCEWAGSGRFNGGKVEHSVTYSKGPNGSSWKEADGKFVLTLSADGRTPTGTWHNNSGGSGAKRLIRQ